MERSYSMHVQIGFIEIDYNLGIFVDHIYVEASQPNLSTSMKTIEHNDQHNTWDENYLIMDSH